MRKLIMGIDIGTSACKIAVFTETGQVIASVSEEYSVYYPQNGWAEQNPKEWWEAVCRGIHRVIFDQGVEAKQICGIGVDGQSWSAIPIDTQGNVLANTPIWMDVRAREICNRVKQEMEGDEIFDIAGNDFLPSYSTPKMLWFKEERGDVYEHTYRFLQSNSYIVYQMTGILSQDYSQGYGIHFFNIKDKKMDGTLALQLGLSTDLIPKLYASDEIVGTVNEYTATLTGLLKGTPVVAGGLDAACGALGAGVYKEGQTQEQGGQAGGMSICMNQPLSNHKLILSPHVVPDMWLLQGGTVGGGGTLKWFRQEFCSEMSFEELSNAASNIPVGSQGVTFLPYMAGERSPIWNPDAKGVLYGMTYDKTRAHMIRAIMEGVAYSLEHNLRTAEETGVYVNELHSMGGSANSYTWTQMKADVTGKRIQVPYSDTATTLGAAILAGIGCGIYEDYDDAIRKTIRITRTHEPNPEAHCRYQQSMVQYLQLYTQLKEVFSQF